MDALAGMLGEHFGAEIVLIGAVRLAETERIEVHSLYSRTGKIDITEYDACDSPCRAVVTEGVTVVVPSGFGTHYPKDAAAQQFGLESYVGVPLKGSNGQVIGLILIESKKVLDDSQAGAAVSALTEFKERTSRELDNLLTTRTLGAVISGTASLSSSDVFRALTRQVADALVVRTSFIAECIDDDPDHFRMLAYSFRGQPRIQAEGALVPYALTPCQLLKKSDTVHIPKTVQQDFPEDALFIEQGLIAYVARVLRDRHGKVIGHIALLHDRELSERLLESPVLETFAARASVELERHQAEAHRSQMEQALLVRKKAESLGLLAGTIAHDFNNLLASLLGYTELALEKAAGDDVVRTYLEKARDVSLSGKDLLRQLLNYAGGSPDSQQTVVDLNRLVRDTISLVPETHRSRDAIHYDLDELAPEIRADASRITQLVMNLALNSLEALVDDEDSVRIGTSTVKMSESLRSQLLFGGDQLPDECVVLEVHDTGRGMEADVAPRVFDPYFTTKHEGRGLGMAAIHGIVRSYNAGLWIRSEPGAGTTVRVYFAPAGEQYKQSLPVADSPAYDTHSSGGERILVVDDQKQVREVLGLQLISANFQVDQAGSCDEALELVRSGKRYSAAFIDIVMPQVDGWETLTRIRELDSEMKAVMVTGFAPQPDTELLDAHRDIQVLGKPYTRQQMFDALQNLLPSTSA